MSKSSPGRLRYKAARKARRDQDPVVLAKRSAFSK